MVTTRWKLAAAAAVAGTLAVSACSSGSGSGSEGDGGSSGGTVSLTFWNGFTGPDRPAVEHLVKTFNASHPKIHITMQITPWDVLYSKLLPAYGAKKGPDMVGMDSNQVPVYASKGVLQPITSMFGSGGVDKSSIVGPALSAGDYQGQSYGAPLENTPILLYYNKKLFKAAGLDPDSPPTTWAQWAADAKKLTTGTGPGGKPKQYGLALGVHDTIEVMPVLLWEGNGGIVSDDGKSVLLDDAASVKTVQYWADLVANDHISPIGLSGADADKLMQSGTAAMEVNGPWATTGYKQAGIDYGLAPVPTGPSGKQTTLGNTTDLVVGASASQDKVAAITTFYKYWSSPAQQTYFALHTGFPPVNTSVSQSALSSNPDVAAFSKYADTARGLLPGQANFAQMSGEIFDPTIEKILNHPTTVKANLTAAAKQIQPLLGGS